MKELFDSFVILQVECQKVVLNKHQIIFLNQKASLIFFKIPLAEKILVK
jgi:hypothetical protein